VKRISVFVVGLALMVAGPAVAQDLPVPLPPVPSLPSLPPVPTVPAIELPVPEVEVPASLPGTALPQVPQLPSAGGPPSPGTAGTGSTASRPAAATNQRAGSRGGGAAMGGASDAVRRSTASRTGPAGRQAARGSRAAAHVHGGRDEPRVVRRERRLRNAVRRFRGCLDGLTQLERKVLVLRAGLGVERPHTRSRVARLLDLQTRRVGRVERSGLRRLRVLGRSGACVAAPTTGGSAPAPASVSAAPRLWAGLPGDLALPLGHVEVKGEQDSSSSEPALVPPPEAIVPPAGAVVARTRNGAGSDLTIPLLVVLVVAAIAFAVRSTRRSLRPD
jgi:Sigma-70, region 4